MNRNTAASAVYVLGVMVAISAAAKVPDKGTSWPDTLPLFAGGIAVSLAGLVAWRVLLRGRRGGAGGDSQSVGQIFTQIQDARREARAIDEDWDRLDGDSVRKRLDCILLEFTTPVVENRDQLIRRYGMRQGAELILQLSLGERNLNRVWSAAADGHLPEAHASLLVAAAALDELVASLDAQEGTTAIE